MLPASSEMSAYLAPAPGKKHGYKEADIKSLLTKLEEGKVNQSINQFPRNFVQPSLPAKFAKLGVKAEKLFAWLFGVFLVSESINALEREQIEVFIEG